MKGWKVINTERQSCRASHWNMHQYQWSVTYPINVEVFPKVEGSKLFFFKTEVEAYKFSSTGDRVVPCIAKGVTKVKWVGKRVIDLNSFWKNRSKAKWRCKKEAPEGTYLADSITCLE